MQHPSGISTEFTPPTTGDRNQGVMAMSIPGACWAALSAENRLELITDVPLLDGFYRCSRWDAQLTTLDPEVTIREFVRDVEAGKIWPKRFGSGNAYGERNLHGDYLKPPTQYFGAKESQVMARIYDHGAVHDWPMASMRFELQFRKQWANDHWDRLHTRAKTEMASESGSPECEELMVKKALRHHLDLRDTTQWVGKRKPKNWAQKAPTLDWYERLLDTPHEKFKATHRPEATWERAQEVMIEQYGRKCAKQLLVDMAKSGSSYTDQCSVLGVKIASMLKPEDLLELLAVLPDDQANETRKVFHELTGIAGDFVDEIDDLKGAKPPRG
jgi:hypothetical protein